MQNNPSTSTVATEARGNIAKRPLLDLSPEQDDERRKVADLDVAGLRMLIRDVNKEVLDKLSYVADDVDKLKEQNIKLQQELECLKADKDQDRKRITQLEEQLKSKNLIFKGLNAKSSVKAVVHKVCFEKLKVPNTVTIKSTRKLYERDGKMSVLVEMDSDQSVQDILRNSKKLAGTSIYIEKDLSADKQTNKKVMLQLKKELLVISKLHKVIVVNDRIKIKDKWMWWNKEKTLMCGKQQGYETLKELYTNDFDKININYNNLLKNLISKN